MKLFKDMTPTEKLDHVEGCLARALPDVLAVTALAEVVDVWDYWAPYLIARARKLERMAEEVQEYLKYYGTTAEVGKLVHALANLEAE